MNKEKYNKQNGFTLIEILITIFIFSIGVLALAAMQISAIKSNQFSRTLATASTLAGDKVEKFMRTDFDNADLTAGTHTQVITEGQVPYTLTWTVTDDVPSTNSKQVNLRVTWAVDGQNKVLQLYYYKPNRGVS